MNKRDLVKIKEKIGNSITIIETYQHSYYLDNDDVGDVVDIWFLYKLPKSDEVLKGIVKHNGELQLISCQNCGYYIGQSECECNNRFIVFEENKCKNYSKWINNKKEMK